MKKVILEIDDRYADVLSFTAVGYEGKEIYLTVSAMDLNKGTYIVVNHDGKSVQIEVEE